MSPADAQARATRAPRATEQAIVRVTSSRRLLVEFFFELIGEADARVDTDEEAAEQVAAYVFAHADEPELAGLELDAVDWPVLAAAVTAAVAPVPGGAPFRSAERAALLGALLGRAWSLLERSRCSSGDSSLVWSSADVRVAARAAVAQLSAAAVSLNRLRGAEPRAAANTSQLTGEIARWLRKAAACRSTSRQPTQRALRNAAGRGASARPANENGAGGADRRVRSDSASTGS